MLKSIKTRFSRVARAAVPGAVVLSLVCTTTAMAGTKINYNRTKTFGDPSAGCDTVWKYMDSDGTVHVSEAWYNHYVLHTDEKVKCTDCGELFDDLDAFEDHVDEENGLTDEYVAEHGWHSPKNPSSTDYVWVLKTDGGWVELDGTN